MVNWIARLAKSPAILGLLLMLVTSSHARAQDFPGVVSPTLTPFRMTVAACGEVAELPPGLAIASSDSVSRCSFDVYVRSGAPEHVQALIVRPKTSAATFAYIDADRNGRFTATERVAFRRAHDWALRAVARASVRSFSSGSDTPLPFEIGLPSREAIARTPGAAQSVWYTVSWFVTSTVVIDGRVWYFRHTVSPDAEEPDLNYGWSSVGGRQWSRTNPTSAFSQREQLSNGEPAVFRLGSRYVSVAAIDMQQRRIIVRDRDRADYRRLEIYEGMTLPNFEFVDLDGHPRQLSEFRGRAVLLNFWYAGCSPCSDEFTYLRDALQRFGPDALVILGFSTNPNEKSSVLRQKIGSEPPGWIEADPWNVSRLVEEWFHVHSTPSQVLIGPDGRVRRLGTSRNGRSPLRGSDLLATLERVVAR